MIRMKHPLIVTAVAAIALAFASPSAAQFGSRSLMTQAFEPYVKQRDLPILMETLTLEEWQRPIVDMLVEDYLASFNAGIETLRTRMQEAGAGSEKGDIGALLRPLQTWRQERQEIYNRFADLVRSQLSAAQLERWPAWERAVRRERLLPLSELSGEGINLVGIMTDLAPPAEFRAAASPAIEAYEVRIDLALTNRQTREDEVLPATIDAMAALDYQKSAELQGKVMAMRVVLRDAQEQGVREIADSMGPEWGGKFRLLAMQRAYPEVFTPNAVMRLYEAALALTDLTDEQRTSVISLKGEFQREWDTMSDEFLAVVKREEPKGPQQRSADAAPAGTPEQRKARGGEMEAMRGRRHEIGERYRQLLEKVLTAEQFAALPGAQKFTAGALGSKSAGRQPAESAMQSERPEGAGRRAPNGEKGRGGVGAGSRPPTEDAGGRDAPPASVE